MTKLVMGLFEVPGQPREKPHNFGTFLSFSPSKSTEPKGLRVTEKTEAQLKQLKAGKTDAFKVLYDEYADKVYGTALRMLGSEPDAADVAQEVFLTISQKIGNFEGRSSLSTWIYRIAVNASLDRRRKMSATAILSIEEFDGVESNTSLSAGALDPTAQVQANDLRDAIRGAIASLTPKLAAVMTLRYSEALEYEQIAEVLGCSIGTVKSRIARAHKKLTPYLERIYHRHIGDAESGDGQ